VAVAVVVAMAAAVSVADKKNGGESVAEKREDLKG
jgi:hypothetical protein